MCVIKETLISLPQFQTANSHGKVARESPTPKSGF